MNKIKLSICIPAYNAESWILETLNSALPLKRADIEIVVSNNHSTDSTLEIVKQFKRSHDQIVKVVEPSEHLSMAANWNFAINSTSGEYVALVSADDLISSEMCERAIAELDQELDVDVVTFEHDKLIHRRNDKIIQVRRIAAKLHKNITVNTKLILNYNPFSINFSFIRLNSIKLNQIKVDGNIFTRNLLTTDYDFWIKLTLAGARIKYIPDLKGLYRIHECNLSNGKEKMLIQTFLVLAKHREELMVCCKASYRFVMSRLLFRSVIRVKGNSKKLIRLMKALLLNILMRKTESPLR